MIGTFVWFAMGCGPKPAPVPASPPGDASPWIEVEPGKDLCVSAFDRVPWSDPAHEAAYDTARAALQRRDLDQARGALLHPAGTHPALDGLAAIVDLLDGALDGPAAALNTLSSAHPDNACLASTAALALWARGDHTTATAMLRSARLTDPTDPRIAFLSWFMAIESSRALLDVLEAGRAAEPDHPGFALAIGALRLEAGEVDAAVEHLDRAHRAGLPEAAGPLLQGYFLMQRWGDYLALASGLGLPLGDDGALALASDPEAAFRRLLGTKRDTPLVAILHTDLGPIHCTLRPDLAPITVANFVGLARGTQPWFDPGAGTIVTRPLYTGTQLHRVIPEFMIQGGDPLGTGFGGPGYTFLDEIPPADAVPAPMRFDRPGILAMANNGTHTNGSQFFVTEAAASDLDGRFTIFGQCDEAGIDVVRQITGVAVDGDDRPVEPIFLERIEIVP